MSHRTRLLGAAALWLLPLAAGAQDSFVLGTIVLTAEDERTSGGTSSTVTSEQVLRENRETLDDALKTVPGVNIGNTGGSRNERLVHVRGFDRFQVPLSIDGIRVYLPADNRLDFGRFLTPDLAEIQIQKGYVSVLNGPGGMGGAINLVTRQPTEPSEGEARLGFEAGNRGDIAARTGFLSLGTKQENFWLQGSYLKRDNDGFYLSRDFTPRLQEDGRLRDNSDTEDDRLNLKAGWTPNATDEYVLSYTRQTGAKNAPYNVDQPIRGLTPPPGEGQSWQRDWTWPEWDIDGLAFYSHTELGDGYVKTRAYVNRFDNILSAWDDYTHTTQTQRRAFDSRYNDKAWGLSLEAGADLAGGNTLRSALHYRRDKHETTQFPSPDLGPGPDPTEVSEEETISVALENTWGLRDDLTVIGGISYDKATVLKADRTDDDRGLPTGTSDAVNWQLAALWRPDDRGEFHASLSSRTRFPTLFNRYSTRFGTAEPNPDLESERATNFEIGYAGDLGPARIETALFYSKIEDLILSVPIGAVDDEGGPITQSRNVGDGTAKGFEIAADWRIDDRLSLAANYTWLQRSISDPVRDDYRPTDTPRHSAYLRLDWQATDRLTVAPSVEIYSSRLSESAIQPDDPEEIGYTRIGGFALVNLNFDWLATQRAGVVFGVRNLFDRDYQLVEGFPEPGRSFFLTTKVTF
ncbi:TonB-dependent siderophore receptor [Paracoccus sp. (in: a-proteobacteria)]|uniref:TonB-dependent receptor plug domain-containing protein n=1 Tax=Paracoccus sp. TaxID=267 RepID=UPI0026E10C3A|nr:TonB-dependent receptor [Paracoccus sp. (in: a-proteobacteria)]MDO5371359.1 TonB-dependent receptor [Paracoccus sp. (in: a-proteobacteria)]